MDLAMMREAFTKSGLSREDLQEDPVAQFEQWFCDAEGSGMRMPNAMSLATVAGNGQPSLRTVLLKYFDAQGFVFFTNYGSRKARELDGQKRAALLFPWLGLERQVHITGRVERVSTAESAKYFLSRPHGSQIGAWVSEQSNPISSRQLLMAKFAEMRQKFRSGEVPLPSFWGGYRVLPEAFEFWQGREHRLHDRFLYSLQPDGRWGIERLAP